jgi:adenine phosphoribosyltransferase
MKLIALSFLYLLTIQSESFGNQQAPDQNAIINIPVFNEPLEGEVEFKFIHRDQISFLKSLIRVYPDFPKAGILFEDFLPILNNPKGMELVIDLIAEFLKNQKIDAICGLESRGFLIGSALAYKMKLPFIPLRKKGKLPGDVYFTTYEKEYGLDTLCLAKNAITQDQSILIIDDLIATGGSAKAAIDLIRQAKASPVLFISLLEIKSLEGRNLLGIPSFNLID